MTPISRMDLIVVLLSVLIDIPFVMKLTGWRTKTSVYASLFVNVINLVFGLIALVFIQLYHVGILKSVGYLSFPFYYFDFPLLASFFLTLITLIPLLAIKPLFKLGALKLFSMMIQTKQVFGLISFLWLATANVTFVAIMLLVEKLL